MPIDAAKLDDGATLLTVNNRLAQEWHRRYDQLQAASGKHAWPTPNIVPWNAWLKQAYEQAVDSGHTARMLLNAPQERLLWERVVRQSRSGGDLLNPAAAAKTAQQAWGLVKQWQLEPGQLSLHASEETRVYLGWQKSFEEICAREALMSSAELPQLLIEATQASVIQLPQRMLLAGFDALSPVQRSLLDTLSEHGVDIEQDEPSHQVGKSTRIEAADRESEIRMAASWANDLVRQNPEANIAVVSPGIEKHRATFMRLFTEITNPQSYLPGGSSNRAFNLSLGQALADFPLIAHVLLMLELLLGKPLAANAISTLLRSPFFGGHAEEWDKRAQLDFQLRDDGLPNIDLFRLALRARQFTRDPATHCPDLIARLQKLDELLKQLPRETTPNIWAGHLLQLIEHLGWPGDCTLNSEEYQQASKFRETISVFSTLARVQRRMRLPEVVRRLRQLCEETIFQPQSDPAPIQVLGPLEAAGMQFDALWLCGLDDRAWPASASPNPLLPAYLQRELDMPHASSTRELAFARHLTQQLLSSAPQIVVSHAVKDGDQEQRPSPLIASLPTGDTADFTPHDRLFAAAAIAGSTDSLPPPEAVPPAQTPRGGSGLLSDQAACPFRAVGRHRLKAKALPEAQSTPSAALLGSMLHDLLQRVWNEIGNAQALRQSSDAQLAEQIATHARDTLNDLGRQRPDVFTPAFIELEILRLTDLVLDWLNLEKQRALPFSLRHTEQKQNMQLAGLSLQLRADRIDQLDDGRLVIIDYKSSEHADAKGWQDQRPTELQVPLYCLETEQPPAAALIARVHSRSTAFKGYAADDNIVPGINAFEGEEPISDWSDLLAHWRTALTALAEEILAGTADIAPQDEKACTYCELGPLCRISSLAQSSQPSLSAQSANRPESADD